MDAAEQSAVTAERARKLAGLQTAEAVKLGRARLRAEIKSGRVGYLDAIEGNLDHVQPFTVALKDRGYEWAVGELVKRLRVGYVLQSVPGIGPVSVGELLDEVGVKAGDRMGTLTYEQRKQLADLVEALMRFRGLLA